MPTALIAGATGLIGRHLLDALLEQTCWTEVITLTRRPLLLRHPRMSQLVADFDHIERIHLESVDVVFCCLGTTMRDAGSRAAFRRVDYEYPLAIARRARAAGARRFLVVSSIGADPDSPVFYLRTKGELERDLAEAGFDTLQLFRPSLLLGERSESRPGEQFATFASPLLQWMLAGRLRRLRPIAAATVARAMASAAGLPVSGPHLYFHDDMIRLQVTCRLPDVQAAGG